MPRGRRSTPVLQELFAERQVYVRSGLTSRYVALSRPLQISVAVGLGVIVLWLGLATYTAVAKHLQTVAQGRELARLESVTKTLRTTVEESESAPPVDRQAEAVPDLMTELANANAARDRAHTLAEAAAGEATELRRELALAHDQIRELKCDLARADAEGRSGTDKVTKVEDADGRKPDGAGLTLAGQVALPDPGCPPPGAAAPAAR
jgi:hypothetical protein